MTKTTRALNGATKDAFFRDVITGEGDVSEGARERLIGRFQKGVSQVRVRVAEVQHRGLLLDVASEPAEDDEAPAAAPAFDPFTPNVLVVVRRHGEDEALSQLVRIGDASNLRLLAREQQLSIGDDVRTTREIALAIVEAATRRIANMRAAAR